ncbi:MAG: hypothetical protein DRI77_08350 [Chloroflexi bacterium]|nr:MAG: hypothetical protein DRI77_08350 [Chloroflexota bacterium]
MRHFPARGVDVTLLAPADSFVTERCAATAARTVTYDWETVAAQDRVVCRTWAAALRGCDVVLCTLHPPHRGSAAGYLPDDESGHGRAGIPARVLPAGLGMLEVVLKGEAVLTNTEKWLSLANRTGEGSQ